MSENTEMVPPAPWTQRRGASPSGPSARRTRGDQEAPALASLEKQIQGLEKQQAGIRQRFEGSAAQLVYADILWGLFNSTEFAFNH